MPMTARKLTVLLLLGALVIGFFASGSTPHQPPLQVTVTPDESLIATPLPTIVFEEDSGGTGWIAVSFLFFICMVAMLAFGILIAFVIVRLRTRRG